MRTVLILSLLLLAGCTGPTSDSAGPDAASATNLGAEAADESSGMAGNGSAPYIQEATVSWVVPATVMCQASDSSEPPELGGVDHGRLGIDAETVGGSFVATFHGAEPGLYIGIVFYDADDQKLGGRGALPTGVYPANPEPTLRGTVPDDAVLAIFVSCASSTSVSYQAGDLPDT